MKVAFLSNFYNHHQSSLCQALLKETEGNFVFIVTEKVPDERLKLGYLDENEKYPWIIRTYESQSELMRANKAILDSDILIAGDASPQLYAERLSAKKLTFKYSERIYKSPQKWYKYPIRALKHFCKNNKKNFYLLCAGAFAYLDYFRIGSFINKAYKWGYFPPKIEYSDIDSIIEQKEKNSIIWVGRFIDWKHPEYAIEVARRLKDDGFDFELKFVGGGAKDTELKQLVVDNQLEDCIKFHGNLSPTEVRSQMAKSEVFLFTSDRGEGWGAVLNEAMNSACAVVASHAIGSVPYLIRDGENGCVYQDGNVDELYTTVKSLLADSNYRKKLGAGAYSTIVTEWNADVAARRLISLSKEILSGNIKTFPKVGLCSRARLISDKWYKSDN